MAALLLQVLTVNFRVGGHDGGSLLTGCAGRFQVILKVATLGTPATTSDNVCA